MEGRWVFSSREKNDKSKIFMVPVDNKKKKTLILMIQKYFKPRSIIYSDCWRSYHCLKDLGYIHKTVNYFKQFINYKNGACTNKIKVGWRHAKHCMPHYEVKKGLHYGYLAQFL